VAEVKTNKCLAQSNKSRTGVPATKKRPAARRNSLAAAKLASCYCDEATEVRRPNLREEDMALITCPECGREISDKAVSCPGCGAPVAGNSQTHAEKPRSLSYNRRTDTFNGSMVQMVKLAMRAIQELGWKLDQTNETVGLVTFQTGMSWGSWSGISCSLNIEEISPGAFRVLGTGKQNVRGGQVLYQIPLIRTRGPIGAVRWT